MLWSAVTPRSIKSQDLDCGRRFIPEDLVALSAKNAILIIEMARQGRAAGKSIVEATRGSFTNTVPSHPHDLLHLYPWRAPACPCQRRRRQRTQVPWSRRGDRNARLYLSRRPFCSRVLRGATTLGGTQTRCNRPHLVPGRRHGNLDEAIRMLRRDLKSRPLHTGGAGYWFQHCKPQTRRDASGSRTVGLVFIFKLAFRDFSSLRTQFRGRLLNTPFMRRHNACQETILQRRFLGV